MSISDTGGSTLSGKVYRNVRRNQTRDESVNLLHDWDVALRDWNSFGTSCFCTRLLGSTLVATLATSRVVFIDES